MRYQRKKGSYKFTDKRHPIDAIVAVLLAFVLLIVMIVVSYKSSQTAGNGPMAYGMIGFCAMILSFAGFVTSILTLKKKEIFYLFPTVGAVLNGLLFIGLFVVYVLGASI